VTKVPRLLVGGFLFVLTFCASDWALSRCVWALHAWRFAQSGGSFGAFWLPVRPQGHGNAVRFLVRYAVILFSCSVGTAAWARFNLAVSLRAPKPVKMTVIAIMFVVPLTVALVVATLVSNL